MTQKILVIDDSQTIHPLINTILADEALEIVSASNPDYGLALADSVHPDLILLDVDMPGMDGFEVCKRLKENPATAKCAVIFLTSHAEMKEKVRGFTLGAIDYVTKPFNRSELIARVRSALRNSQVIHALETTSLLDPLTGLGNRAMFVQRISAEICLRARFGDPLSLIALNVDHFAKINETYGKQVGDQVLTMVGKTLTDLCRLEDVACYVGGDDFVVIAPHTSGADARIFAERVCEMLANKPFKAEGESLSFLAREPFHVTASFAVAGAADRYDRSMMRRADETLYRAKQQGRNRVLLAPSELSAAA